MRRAPTAPGYRCFAVLLLLAVSLACRSPSPRAVQEQAHSAAVVLEGQVQAAAAAVAGGPGPGNGGALLLVKVLDVWPLRSGGLQREQLIRVAAPAAPCFQAQRRRRYIFFLEPTDEPLVFAPAFAPLDASDRPSLKKDLTRLLCARCGERLEGGALLEELCGGRGLLRAGLWARGGGQASLKRDLLRGSRDGVAPIPSSISQGPSAAQPFYEEAPELRSSLAGLGRRLRLALENLELTKLFETVFDLKWSVQPAS